MVALRKLILQHGQEDEVQVIQDLPAEGGQAVALLQAADSLW